MDPAYGLLGNVAMSFIATKCLELNNIRLKSASFLACDSVAEMLIDGTRCTILTRHWTSHRFVERVAEGGVAKVLLASVNLGIRMGEVEQARLAPDEALYTIEACYIAEFVVKEDTVSAEDLDEFVKKNATHVVWPFWRQHIFATLQGASLPNIALPLLARVKA